MQNSAGWDIKPYLAIHRDDTAVLLFEYNRGVNSFRPRPNTTK